MALAWYRFEWEKEEITKVVLAWDWDVSLKHVRGRFNLNPKYYVLAYDELDAFILASKWMKLGKPGFGRFKYKTAEIYHLPLEEQTI